jgi:hypothetical protein
VHKITTKSALNLSVKRLIYLVFAAFYQIVDFNRFSLTAPTKCRFCTKAVTRIKARTMNRILAALLVLGGLIGAGTSASNGYAVARMHLGASAGLIAIALLFLFTALTGIRLWRGDPRGSKWASILFALQIPVITLRHFDYEFFTGLTLKFVRIQGTWDSNFLMGSSLNLLFDEQPTSPRFGINVVALMALLWLTATNSAHREERFANNRAGTHRRRLRS